MKKVSAKAKRRDSRGNIDWELFELDDTFEIIGSDQFQIQFRLSKSFNRDFIQELIAHFLRQACRAHRQCFYSFFAQNKYRYITVERSRVNPKFWHEVSLTYNNVINEMKDLKLMFTNQGIRSYITGNFKKRGQVSLSTKFEDLLNSKGVFEINKITNFKVKNYHHSGLKKEFGHSMDFARKYLSNVAHLLSDELIEKFLTSEFDFESYNTGLRKEIRGELNELSDLRKMNQRKIEAFFYLIKWIRKFGIGELIYLYQSNNDFRIEIIKNDKRIGLNDIGFGSSQLLGVMLEITYAIFYNKVEGDSPVIIIEEIESNLHPDAQVKLGDMLIDYQKRFGLQFILETHSDHLLRHFQINVRKKGDDTLGSSNVNINYLKDGSSENVRVNEQGMLSKSIAENFYGVAAQQKVDFLNSNK